MENSPETLTQDSILIAEFEYIAHTVTQNLEDRARVSTFYLVTVGSFIAAILSTQAEQMDTPLVYLAFAILFALLSMLGLLTVLQLVKLRLGWLESVKALNQIKQCYIASADNTELGKPFSWNNGTLGDAFAWTNRSLPNAFKLWSVSFILALQVMLLSGITLGASVFFVGLRHGELRWCLSLSLGLAYLVFQFLFYAVLLRRSH